MQVPFSKYLYASLLIFMAPLALKASDGKIEKTLLERLSQPKISFESTYMDRADIEGSEGNVQVIKNRIKINNSTFGFSYTNWTFDWDNVDKLPFGDGVHHPVEQMHGLNFSMTKPYRINEKWFSLSLISLNSTFEDNPKNSLSFGLFTFASYTINDDHTIQIGAFGSYHPVRTLVLPIVSYSYRARHKDGIQVILGFPNTHIGYHFNRDTLIRLGVVYSNSLFRLSDNSSVEPSGFNEFQDFMGNAGISYDLNRDIKLTGDFLYSIKRDFTIYDKHGTKLESYVIEPAAGIKFTIIWKL